ncbi:tRNA (adenosine(37)-N6)-dimethylallyltransferase MiaA [Paenibacillus crassostreae]|uniref:tRNA dimethylallyltransferase n=1 Tax=Paenibacillus crassostreae TaxID=1763538 RepID=A0A167DRR7_9BACL|nr:tRNA (adenosine(37)-N6)-dimethylallyltransferase MiaA [Paenibacillus crassostreae]AOZ91137.1 tRNA (adenosine(37)-N6)-dimethylallyltransferase MiaA [Paenibacillus crassostreae]OAB74705.1 tRNA dimethylallyltransferase [Paenibacillus crassostreae]
MTTENKPSLLVLLGPTAVGKTKTSIEIAKLFNCEIISGDSMQVYRQMDIGTAKITVEEMDGIPHHLIDIHDPDEAYSVAEFQEQCRRLIGEIHDRGRIPMIVGGTGLYIESVCYGFQFTDVGADEQFRSEQFAYAESHGAEALHDRLRLVDPMSAERLHVNDQRRIVRALEIYHLTNTTLSDQMAAQSKESPYDLCIVGLTMDRQILYKRIEDRIDLMLQQGLIEEVTELMKKGYGKGLISMQGLGYKEVISFLEDELTREEMVTLLKRDTRRFAKRQLSWFRHMGDIVWIDVTDKEKYSENFIEIRDIIAGKLLSVIE